MGVTKEPCSAYQNFLSIRARGITFYHVRDLKLTKHQFIRGGMSLSTQLDLMKSQAENMEKTL